MDKAELSAANQQAAKAVHPGVRALDHPAAGFLAGLACLGLRFFATRADVSDKAESRRQGADFLKIIALVQAEVLRLSGRSSGPFDRDAHDGFNEQLEVVFVR